MEPLLTPMPDPNPEIEPIEKHQGIPLVVLGSGWNEPTTEGSQNLNMDAKLRVLAAGEFFLTHREQISEIILTGSDFDSGKPSQAQDLKDYLIREFPQIDESRIKLEEKPRTTAEEAEAIKNRLGDSGAAFIITSSFALKRAKTLFKNYGLEAVDGIGAEDYLKTISEKGETIRLTRSKRKRMNVAQNLRMMRMLVKYQKSLKYRKEQAKEAIQNIALIFDKKAKIPRIIAGVRRKHQ